MKVVIDIEDLTYEGIKNQYCILPPQKGLLKVLWGAIRNSTVLPSGQVCLIDYDRAKSKMIPLDWSVQKWISEVDLSDCITMINKDEVK